MKRYDVCAVVVSDLTFDARVWKEVHSLTAAGYRVRLIGCVYETTTTRRRRVDGIDVVEVPLGTRAATSAVSRIRTLVRLWAETLVADAAAYHCHNIHPGPAAYLAARVRHARLVYDGHELYGSVPPSASLRSRAVGRVAYLIERFMVRHSDASITTNPSRREMLKRRHGSHLEPLVLANVPARAPTVTPLDPGYPPNARVLLYQGGIYARQRAFRETIHALRFVPDLHFVVLGFGRDEDLRLIQAWADEFGVSDRVHQLPPRPYDELVHTAAAATIGIVPIKPLTLNEVLGDTNKLHEYLMAGLPVVASDLPEIRRVVRGADVPVGELFDPSSAASIADALRRALADDGLLRARGLEARRQALAVHNWEVEERRLIDLYVAIIGHRMRTVPATSTSA